VEPWWNPGGGTRSRHTSPPPLVSAGANTTDGWLSLEEEAAWCQWSECGRRPVGRALKHYQQRPDANVIDSELPVEYLGPIGCRKNYLAGPLLTLTVLVRGRVVRVTLGATVLSSAGIIDS
jgi:hypothetical protein